MPADVHAALTVLDLRNAHLPDVELRPRRPDDKPANLSGADLTRADLTDANLTDANLTDADLEASQVVSAVLDSTTKLPSDLAEDPDVLARIAELEGKIAEGLG